MIYAAKWLVDSGTLEKWFGSIQEASKEIKLPNISIPSLGGGGGGGGVYKHTGKVMTARQEGPKRRNYASGKPSDTTTEWNVDNCPFSAYEFDADVTIGKIEHDDAISMKLYGPNHSDGARAWYVNDVEFKSGQARGGWEDPHPDGDYNCVRGGRVGSIVGKTTHVKSVIWPLAGGGAHVEFYVNGRRMYSVNNPCGKRYSRHRNQQVQLRIDAAPGVRATNVRVSEIVPPT